MESVASELMCSCGSWVLYVVPYSSPLTKLHYKDYEEFSLLYCDIDKRVLRLSDNSFMRKIDRDFFLVTN